MNVGTVLISDKYYLVSSLKDSLKEWRDNKKLVDKHPNITIASTSARQAITESLQKYFGSYDIKIINTTGNSAVVEAALPQIYGLTPFVLKFEMQSTEFAYAGYEINANWHIEWEILAKQTLSFSSNFKKVNNKRNINRFSNLIEDAALRYSTMSLPVSLQPGDNGSDDILGQLIVHSTKIDTISWRGLHSSNNIFRGLAKGKITYYFPHNFSIATPKANFESYAVIKDEQLLYNHVIRIEEIYSKYEDDIQLEQIIAHLFPYIRTDNVRNLFAEPDTASYQRKSVEIWR